MLWNGMQALHRIGRLKMSIENVTNVSRLSQMTKITYLLVWRLSFIKVNHQWIDIIWRDWNKRIDGVFIYCFVLIVHINNLIQTGQCVCWHSILSNIMEFVWERLFELLRQHIELFWWTYGHLINGER